MSPNHVELILQGHKTQTRRIHSHEWKLNRVCGVRDKLFGKPVAHILVTRKFQQRLGNISLAEVHKEGFGSFEEFKQGWIEINGCWDPDCVVWAYEFCVVDSTEV